MPEQLYVYRWGNNARRLELKGRICRVIHRLKTMNTQVVKFVDNGEVEIISRNALRKLKV